jgi:fermentation-respiration switch protein FrsA (DUF1100 family)
MKVGEETQSWRRRWFPSVRRLAITVVATYAAVCALLFLFQSHLIYFPARGYDAVPSDVGLAFEDLTLVTSDGLSIAAWYVPHAEARGSVIFCHGNAGNIADRLYSVKLLNALGCDVLIFDYRGYGRSEGSPTEAGTYADADTAWRYLVESKGKLPERIIIFGRSLGGAVAIELARRHPPAALVVESTFTCMADVGRVHYPLLPVGLLLRHRYDSVSKVPKIDCPKLFLHGTDDSLIPIANARRLFEAAASPRQFIETPGGHNAGGFAYSPEYTQRLDDFLDAVLGRSSR